MAAHFDVYPGQHTAHLPILPQLGLLHAHLGSADIHEGGTEIRHYLKRTAQLNALRRRSGGSSLVRQNV